MRTALYVMRPGEYRRSTHACRYPGAQCLPRTADLLRDRLNGGPLGVVLPLVLMHHPDGSLPDHCGISRWLVHGSNLSSSGASHNPGAVHLASFVHAGVQILRGPGSPLPPGRAVGDRRGQDRERGGCYPPARALWPLPQGRHAGVLPRGRLAGPGGQPRHRGRHLGDLAREDLERAAERIDDSVRAMHELLADRERNVPLGIEAFPLAAEEQHHLCPSCPFFQMCGAELARARRPALTALLSSGV
jgi:hypothetical protein